MSTRGNFWKACSTKPDLPADNAGPAGSERPAESRRRTTKPIWRGSEVSPYGLLLVSRWAQVGSQGIFTAADAHIPLQAEGQLSVQTPSELPAASSKLHGGESDPFQSFPCFRCFSGCGRWPPSGVSPAGPKIRDALSMRTPRSVTTLARKIEPVQPAPALAVRSSNRRSCRRRTAVRTGPRR